MDSNPEPLDYKSSALTIIQHYLSKLFSLVETTFLEQHRIRKVNDQHNKNVEQRKHLSPDRNRTHDLPNTGQPLYRTELRKHEEQKAGSQLNGVGALPFVREVTCSTLV